MEFSQNQQETPFVLDEGNSSRLMVGRNLKNQRFASIYDISDKQVDTGWVHPGVLQALAHV